MFMKCKVTVDTSHYPKEGPWELPRGWAWCHLSDLASFAGGKTPSMDNKDFWKNGKHLWITSKDMKSRYLIDSQMKISDTAVREMTVFHPGTILMVNRSGILRRTLPLAILNAEATINQDIKAIVPYLLCLSPYLYYAILSQESFILSEYKKAGTTVDNINFDKFISLLIPLPPQKEQDRIVSSINQCFAIIENIDSSQKDLNISLDAAKAKTLDLAIRGKLVPQDPNEEPAIELLMRINPDFRPSDNLHYEEVLPDGWVLVPLSSICSTINGLWKGSKEPLIKVGVIRNANFTKDFTLDYSKIEYIDVELKSFEKRHLEDGDIIVEKSGGSDNFPVGRSIIYQGSNKVYSFSNFTMSLRITDKQQIAPEYLFYVLQHRYRRGDMKQMQTQTTGLHNLLSDIYLSMLIPIPPVNEQERIVVAIKESFQLLDRIRDVVKDTK